MAYRGVYVFPINEVEAFASRIQNAVPAFYHTILAIKRRGVYPLALHSQTHGGTSQVRRILYYLALKKFNLWNQFVSQHWPTANGPDGRTNIRELENEYIHSGKLARHKNQLPSDVQCLVP
jgi:hypothetical protein